MSFGLAPPKELTSQEAADFIAKIAVKHGYIEPATLEAMPAHVRMLVEEALKKDSKGNAAVNELVQDLSTINPRIFYEILQNADDCLYSKAKATLRQPNISFSLFPDTLVVDYNEDGFTQQNVEALCDIRKSTKGGKQGYIGEKNVGFKSLFTVASKINVQSGPWDFYFEHQKGDSGIGMLRPAVATEPAIPEHILALKFQTVTEKPKPGTTRLILHLHKQSSDADRKRQQDSIAAQFWALPETVLLFMRNLANIALTVYDKDGTNLRLKLFTRTNSLFGASVQLRIVEMEKGSASREKIQRYHVYSHLATGLARNENRKTAEQSTFVAPDTTAEIKLAFPMDDKEEPIIQSQGLFAFMPLNTTTGLSILINTDFVTNETRQDIVAESPRNVNLRQGIADAFVKAIKQLCTQSVLQNRWMRYLPREKQLPSDPYWKTVAELIRTNLRYTPIIRPGSERFGILSPISDFCRLPEWQCDQGGKPLVPDLTPEKYPSAAYDQKDLDILTEYGMPELDMADLIVRLQAFMKSDAWKTKALESRDEDWHSRLARLLHKIWDERPASRKDLRQMQLFPMRSGTVQADTWPLQINPNPIIYFSEVDGVLIPRDVNLSMLLPAASSNPDCRKLYQTLGVRTATLREVRPQVMAKHLENETDSLTMEMSNEHLRFLYQMHSREPMTFEEQKAAIVFDHLGRQKTPRFSYVYNPGDPTNDWSPGKLLMPPYVPDIAEPNASILNPIYFVDPPPAPAGYDKKWDDWLYEIIWIEDKVQLFTKRDNVMEGDKEISSEYLYILRSRQERALARLVKNFANQKTRDLWQGDAFGTNLMRKTEVRCMDGVMRPLEDTYLPLPSLLAICGRYSASPSAMPFLQCGDHFTDNPESEWVEYAKFFNIRREEDLTFTLAVLGAVAKSSPIQGSMLTRTVMDLYKKIYTQFIESGKHSDAQKHMRTFFNTNKVVLANLPTTFSTVAPRWVSLRQCVWTGTPEMNYTVPLEIAWRTALTVENRPTLVSLFKQTLLLRDVVSLDICHELANLSSSQEQPTGKERLDRVTNLYKALLPLVKATTEGGKSSTRSSFADKPLIYLPQAEGKQWFKSSECVWSNVEADEEEACVESVYPGMRELFTDWVGVSRVSSRLSYKRLLDMCNNVEGVQAAKTLLWSVNGVLQKRTDRVLEFTDELRIIPIFPVRMPDGKIEILAAADDFAINDRQPYATAFRNEIKILDFTLDETHRLKLLFEWTGLADRYLSNSVDEATSVDTSQRTADATLTQDISGKAHAFARIAGHFNPDMATVRRFTFESSIRRVEVFSHGEIKSTLKLVQDSKEVSVPMGTAFLHIQSGTLTRFQIYVPTDEEARDFGLSAQLPRGIAAYLQQCKPSMVDPRVVAITASILNAKLTAVNRILDFNGITDFSATGTVDVPTTPPRTSASVFGSPSQPPPAVSPLPPLSPPQGASSPYQALLMQVVNVARAATFPNKQQAFDLTSLTRSLQTAGGPSFRFYAGDQTDWQRMVGAAGELYVFELLSRLQALPGFSRNNWQSVVRRFVSVHPDYTTLEPWTGAELSDIYYEDISGTFTGYLIAMGYLEESWRQEKPQYFIEVKTTTSSNIETPFYMSKYQYARMQSFVDGGARLPHQAKKVYILFRVFGLESGQVGVKLYVDLEESRKNGELEFEAQSWTVTPRKG